MPSAGGYPTRNRRNSQAANFHRVRILEAIVFASFQANDFIDTIVVSVFVSAGNLERCSPPFMPAWRELKQCYNGLIRRR